MAIRDIVTMGYGNGIYDPGVYKLPPLGYGVATEVTAPYVSLDMVTVRNHELTLTTKLNTSLTMVPTANG